MLDIMSILRGGILKRRVKNVLLKVLLKVLSSLRAGRVFQAAMTVLEFFA